MQVDLPAWISFPDFERSEWLSGLLGALLSAEPRRVAIAAIASEVCLEGSAPRQHHQSSGGGHLLRSHKDYGLSLMSAIGLFFVCVDVIYLLAPARLQGSCGHTWTRRWRRSCARRWSRCSGSGARAGCSTSASTSARSTGSLLVLIGQPGWARSPAECVWQSSCEGAHCDGN